MDRDVEEAVPQVPLREVGGRLDHGLHIEDGRKPERRRVRLQIGAAREVLARSPLVLLEHHRPRVHRSSRGEQRPGLSLRDVLERSRQNVSVRLEPTYSLGVSVTPPVLVDFVEAVGQLALDPVPFGHGGFDVGGETLASPPGRIVRDVAVGSLGPE